LHGLNDNSNAWQPFSSRFSGTENRWISSNNQSYSSTGGLAAIFGGVSTAGSGSSSITICHSLGGVVARNLDNNNPGNFVGGIVTVGSPLDGAPIANALLNGSAVNAISHSTSAMLRGPTATLGFATGPLFSIAGRAITALFLPFIVQHFLDIDQFGGFTTINDVRVGGSGIETEKTRTPTATPKISIWGNEESPTHWSILQSTTNQDVPYIAEVSSDVYEIFFWTHLGAGLTHTYSPWGWWSIYASYEWYAGWDWIDNDSERIWNNLIGSGIVATQCYQEPRLFCQLDENCIDIPRLWANCPTVCTPGTASVCVQVHSNGISDAYIPATSQRGDGSNSWRIRNGAITSMPVFKREALGVNHFEEIDATNSMMRSRFVEIFSGSIDPVFRIDTK
jgi:pimeloyl-ACP methyl ester carboxylesterase